MKLKKVSKPEIDLITYSQITCGECGNTEKSSSNTLNAAQASFYKSGWREFETDDEISGATCPSCIKKLKCTQACGSQESFTPIVVEEVHQVLGYKHW